MDSIFRAAAVYIILLLIMRLSGKRTFAEITAFDFVLLLIIAETTQQALLGEDFSVTNSALLIVTLVTMDIGMSLFKRYKPNWAKWMDGTPVMLVEDGVIMEDRMDRARVSKDDILESGRKSQGLEEMAQIKHAVLEQSGSISIIPK